MAQNPYGYVPITDGGAPRIITGYAKEVISGGQLVSTSGAAGVVSSGADSFITSDIQFFLTTGSGQFVGIALHEAISGAPVSVATRGSFILEVSGTNVEAGWHVGCNDQSEVIYIGSHALGYSSAINQIGRAWTTGSKADYVIVDLHG